MPSKPPSTKHKKNLRLIQRYTVLRHFGIITGRCHCWYNHLPPAAMMRYDMEDMIQDVVLHILQVVRGYDEEKAAESTYVWHVANNKCLSIVKQFKRMKHDACETVWMTPEMEAVLALEDTEQLRVAVDAVERVIQFSPDPVRDVIEKLMSGTVGRKHVPEQVMRRFKEVADRHSATLADFLSVLHHADGLAEQ